MGLLVGYAWEANIVNSSAAGEVSGTYSVGGLVGYGRDAKITSSYAMVGSVSGRGNNVGGLVGYGGYGAITSSYASVASVSGTSRVGGLVGNGLNTEISSSYASVASVSGTSRVGGLVGNGEYGTITSSYASVASVSGTSRVGGLVGNGRYGIISSSYASVASVSGRTYVGGLVGNGLNAEISSSYASVASVSGTSRVGGLVGEGNYATNIIDSYWDSDTSGITTGSYGEPKTTRELQMPTNFGASVYATWNMHKCDDGITHAWNLGTSFQYPSLTCTPGKLTTQRSYAKVRRSYAVTGLRVIPGVGSATISWNNPYAPIASISISYKITGSDDAPLTKSIAQITPDAKNVQETINDLSNGVFYNFTVSLTLRGDAAGREGDAPSIIAAIGPDYDGDSLVDFLDPDDDNDGVEDNADACDSAGAATSWISDRNTDYDGDGCRNSDEDADDNGNGLIEIHNARELDLVREDLTGRSFAGDSIGCGGQGGITECNGYELAANISLADYANWQPIGSCSNYKVYSRRCENRAALFNAIFDGNGYTISNLTITNPIGDYANGAGLFGAISPASILRNIHIRSANINGGGNHVGLLVGYAREANIANSSAAGEVSGYYSVGGLVGNGRDAKISSSYASVASVNGNSHNVGGLVGNGDRAYITSSYAVVGAVSGSSHNVGGLVGYGGYGTITSSYASVASVSGTDWVGGLVGNGLNAEISSSYASVASVGGGYSVGGLVGYGYAVKITSSYTTVGSISGDEYVGGLVGYGDRADITYSYWDSDNSGIATGTYGEAKTTRELQMPTSFGASVYATWNMHKCDDGITHAWNLGTSFQYPSLTCTPGKLTTQRSYAKVRRSYAVTGLQVVPGVGSATISWNNPYAPIVSISISYKITGSDDAPLTKSIAQITPDAKNVQETINDLSNGVFYNFTVSLTLRGDAAGREGDAPSIIAAMGPDYDGDGLINFVDVDDDGDGLIEIANAEQFNQIRYNLLGSSLNASAVDVGDETGCGGQEGITGCNGYELAANISLADYANWQPIGSCSNYDASSRRCKNRAALFNTIFDGNGYTISNLTITNPIGDYANGAGLFGAISPAAVLRNIHIRSASINGGGTNVGLLVGYAWGANIANSSAAGEVSGTYSVGGLVGYGRDTKITSSYAMVGSVSGRGNNVGGLVGYGGYGAITSSYASVDSVSGTSRVGGLVGNGLNTEISSSYASVDSVSGTSRVGGLVGNGEYGTITSSYASVASVSGTSRVGGLVGNGRYGIISSSYASVASVSGRTYVGGLVGYGGYGAITSSYASVASVSGTSRVGGLVGYGDGADITYSYWDSDNSGIATGTYGEAKTTRELQMPTSFGASVYANWNMHKCDDGITHAWNLGTNFQYPSLTCTPGELTTQRSYAKVRRSYAVTGLRVIPGVGSATLSWNNPYAPIASISISYKITGSDDAPLTKSIAQITPDAKNVQETINDLSNGVFYNFTVSLTLRGDAAGREGDAPSIIVAIGPDYDGDSLVDFLDPDDDNDGVEDNTDAFPTDPAESMDTDNDRVGDNADIDDNGNGLIEIYNARELDLVREDLAGRSFSGDRRGCSGQGGITECNGYELAANISLADYANWQPIGSCSNYDVSSQRCENRAALFNAIFDGNGYTISNLTITNPIGDYANGAGLFGAISPAAVLRNIHIRSANINGGGHVGLLVGYAREANIVSSSAAGEVSGYYSVGGLVGYGRNVEISSSYASVASVRGTGNVGGLVGEGDGANISLSYASVASVSGSYWVGGLVGYGSRAIISSSYASVASVSGSYSVGGLVGNGEYGTITSSYASVASVSGSYSVGGLVGNGLNAEISSSYASVASVGGSYNVGGLVGEGNYATNIIDSYWDSDNSGIATGSYGEPKTTRELQMPTSFGASVYANWKMHKCDDGITHAWNLGTNFQYPSLTCTPGKLTTQRSYAKVRRSYAVTGLQVVPGVGSATLSWNNPYAPIASISISYKITGSDDTPLTKSITQITPDAKNVQETINDLSNGVFYNFTVSLTLRGDAAGREGATPSIIVAIGPDYDGDSLVDFLDPDDDNDGVEDNTDAFPTDPAESMDTDNDRVGDNVDIDVNGNGLIEIYNARELDLVREDLAGRSFSGDRRGCSGQGGITECNGYELAANISLADYANWQPIGSCPNYEVSSQRCENRAALFNTIFDGNGYTISNLTITNPIGDYANGAGLFGAISPASILRNIHIHSANISGGGHVGLLVGYAREANIVNSSAAGEVSGTDNVGGLVGYGRDAKITSSYAMVGSVSGRGNNVGGLVGYGIRATISSSYASVASVSGTYWVGGLVGYGSRAIISSSYASVASVSGSYSVGGLVGNGLNAEISSSYASVASVSGSYNVGGLVGRGDYGTNIIDSYWDSDTSGITTGSYGLPKTTSELQLPTNTNPGIYANWVTDECDDSSYAWDFGTASQYPVLTCTPGKLTPQRSYAKVRRSYAVTGLRVIPGVGSATLSWNNPYTLIASISISYKITGSDDAPLTKSIAQITPDAKNVQETINDLSNGVFYNFTVSLTLRGDAAGREGDAPSIIVAIGPDYDGDSLVDSLDPDDDNDGVEDNADAFPTDPAESMDTDNDRVGDNADIDDNGNGLIEIYNARELDLVREDLAGRSFSGDRRGCSGQGGITECNGYELAANISLADYANWQPIGSCPNYEVSSQRCENRAALFNTIFDGNGYTISNLTITNPIGDYANGAGLFGAISPASILRNIHIHSANISGGGHVGLLVGYAREANIVNSSAAGEVSGTDNVGGLVGYGRNAEISSSYASVASVNGSSHNVGGLVGYGIRATISSSYASVASVSGTYWVGGLVGNGYAAKITSSYAAVGSVSGRGNDIGGLVGNGYRTTISSSYASTGSVSGSYNVGGLVGRGDYATNIIDSYWDSDTSGITTGSYGLPKTTSELQLPTNTNPGIYANWVTDECNDSSYAWDFGTASQYPVLTCTPNGVDVQRP